MLTFHIGYLDLCDKQLLRQVLGSFMGVFEACKTKNIPIAAKLLKTDHICGANGEMVPCPQP